MKLFAIFLLIFIGLFGASKIGYKEKSSYNEVMKIIHQHSKEIKKQNGIQLACYGLDYAGPDKIFDGKIHMIDLGYRVDKNMKIEEGRELFYSLIDGLIEKLNKEESLRDYFYHYPVGYEDFYFRLSFDYESKGHLRQDDVYMIAILYNKIKYFIAEEDGAAVQIQSKEIVPDVHMMTDFFSKTRCITKPLPETD